MLLFLFRLFNLTRLVFSYIWSLVIRKPVLSGYPAFVSIEPTNRCNLRCPECPTGLRGLSRPAGMLNTDQFQRYLSKLPPSVAYMTLYFQGEPFLNPQLPEMIAMARSRKIRVWSSTNGHFLKPEIIRQTIEAGLNRLIISIDGTTQEVYEQYRIGGTLSEVTQGISDFVRIRREMGKRNPLLVIQFLVLKSNEHQINSIRKLGKELGVDKVELKTAQFYEFEQGNPLMPEGGRLRRYRRTGGQADGFALRNPLRNRCFRMWSGCVITWDGKLVPCCYDKDAGHVFGNLNEESFTSIWNGEPAREFRKTIFKARKSIDICRNCDQYW